MKKLLLLLFLVLSSSRLSAEPPKLESPIYLVNTLLTCPNEESMAQICEYYDLTELPKDNDFNVWQYKDGSVIRYKIDKTDEGKKVPVIEVVTGTGKKNIEKILSNMSFQKDGNIYKKGCQHHLSNSVCSLSHEGSKTKLTYTKINNYFYRSNLFFSFFCGCSGKETKEAV